MQGWKSLNFDPANYSAHLFLADTYSNLPRHQIASTSELLQAKLMQPINVKPIQPQLDMLKLGVFGSSRNSILQGAGPTDPSFNEYTPLFTQDGLNLQLNGLAGNNSTYGDVFAQSGLFGKFSYSVGQMHYQTDGFRENNDLDQNVYNAFSQASLSYRTSIQAEYQHTDTKKGDLELTFNPNDYIPTLRQSEHTNSFRLGVHHSITPASDLLVSLIYGAGDFDTHVFDGLDINTDENGLLFESQYLLHSSLVNIITGFGQFNSYREDEFKILLDEETGSTAKIVENSRPFHANFYLYSLVNFPAKVTWTLGGSADFFRADSDLNQFNPKFGINWQPISSTMLRAALFRVVKRTLIASQTIEPTQVAGFNQFFDDPEGTNAWRYGVALDQKLLDSLYGGVEFSWRELDVPYTVITTVPTTKNADWDEELIRLYLYWVINRWFTGTAEFQYEKFTRKDEVGPEMFTDSKTYRVPLGINFYHPSGFMAQLQTTYVNQSGKFGDPGFTLESGSDNFWVVDASIGYRLPKRWGVISLEVKNLFDQKFRFQDTDPISPSIAPDRVIFGRFTVGF